MPLQPHKTSHSATYRLAGFYFPKILGLIYAIAFFSWAIQCEGLVGHEGILPAKDLVENIKTYEQKNNTTLVHIYPTLFRYGSLVDFITPVSVLGGIIGILVFIGIAPGIPLLICWLLYLSTAVIGDVFMNFQWDAFLLETGFLAIFFVPWRGDKGFGSLFVSAHHDPSPIVRFLFYWLLFRLMFQSGLVKVLGGDDSWINLTALSFHYETQPLPHIGGWIAHQAPLWMHQISCLIMHIIELILPFAIFLGKRGRLLAGYGFIALMAAVFFTGNYNFFNLLTAAVALTLFHDSAWPRFLCPRIMPQEDIPPPRPWHHPFYIPGFILAPVVIFLTLLAADHAFAMRIKGYTRLLPDALDEIHQIAGRWRSFNAYGLFQTMTKTRDEIIFEISEDGQTWHPLGCRYKPCAPDQMPRWVAPHQPRLDWQLWFAALVPDGFQWPRDAHRTAPLYWLTKLSYGLLQHRAAIWALFEPPPIEIGRVHYLRAHRYRYRMASIETWMNEGRWWNRDLIGDFLPAISLKP